MLRRKLTDKLIIWQNKAIVQGESSSREAADGKAQPDPCDDEADFIAGGAFEGEYIDEEMTDDREVVEGFYSGAEAQDDAEDGAEDEGFDKVCCNLRISGLLAASKEIDVDLSPTTNLRINQPEDPQRKSQ
jgi:hypothetical protein